MTNASSTSRFSGGKRQALANHPKVVMAVPQTNFCQANNSGTKAAGDAAKASCTHVKYAATTKEMTMAAISVAADMRHQNQRSKNSPPVPAPKRSNKLKA